MNLSPAATQFVEAVVSLAPRIAVFDCDGTLWAGDAGAEFLYWELERGLLPEAVAQWVRPRYRDYLDGKVSEEDICGEMVTIHDGLRAADLAQAAEEFFAAKFVHAIFPEMQALTRRLQETGCELWAVSSTNEWVVRAGIRGFGIPERHVLAACVVCENGIATARLQHVPTGAEKATAIREHIRGAVDVALGNSIHDAAMLDIARHAFAINPNPDLESLARQRGWTVYQPASTKQR